MGPRIGAAMRTDLTELLGIEIPVIQAPMAGAATPELAAAVSAAGALGSLGSATLTPDELLAQAQAVRDSTDRPFNVNFFCHPAPELDAPAVARARERLGDLYLEFDLGEPPVPSIPPIAFDEARLEALLEIRPAVASFHFGLPGGNGGSSRSRRRLHRALQRDHGRGGPLPRRERRRRGDRPGRRGWRPSRQLPRGWRRWTDRHPRTGSPGRRRRRRAGCRGRRHRRRQRPCGRACPRRRRSSDRHRVPRLPRGRNPPLAPSGAEGRTGRGHRDHTGVLRTPRSRCSKSRDRRGRRGAALVPGAAFPLACRWPPPPPNVSRESSCRCGPARARRSPSSYPQRSCSNAWSPGRNAR